MIYELATGRMPFGQPETRERIRQRLWRDPVPPRALMPALSEWFQDIILPALEVGPARRTQTMAQMVFDLAHKRPVRLTERAHKIRRGGRLVVMGRWRKLPRRRRFAPPPSLRAKLQKAAILMVAVDLSPEMERLADRLRLSVKRMLTIEPDARVACVNVIRTVRCLPLRPVPRPPSPGKARAPGASSGHRRSCGRQRPAPA